MKRIFTNIAVDFCWAAAIALTFTLVLGARPHASGRAFATSDVEPERRAANLSLVSERAAETLASEVVWLREGSTVDDRNAVVASLKFLLRERANVTMDDDLWQRLAAEEARVVDGQTTRITLDQLADALTALALERARSITDEEIERAADGFGNARGDGTVMRLSPDVAQRVHAGVQVDAEDLVYVPDVSAAPPRAGVMLRFTGEGQMSAAQFVEAAKLVRFKLSSPRDFALARQFLPQQMRQALDDRLDVLGGAFPNARTEGLTPVQAFLVTYSLASDDWLDFSTADVKVRAMDKATAFPAFKPKRAAEIYQVTPYGSGGALFSTPLDMAFNRATLEAAIDLLEGRAQQ